MMTNLRRPPEVRRLVGNALQAIFRFRADGDSARAVGFVKTAADEIRAGADVTGTLTKLFLSAQAAHFDDAIAGLAAWMKGEAHCPHCHGAMVLADDGADSICPSCGQKDVVMTDRMIVLTEAEWSHLKALVLPKLTSSPVIPLDETLTNKLVNASPIDDMVGGQNGHEEESRSSPRSEEEGRKESSPKGRRGR